MHAGIEHALMDDGTFGVGRGEENPSQRMERVHAVGKLLPAHVRHDDVGKEQIHVARARLMGQAQGLDAIGRGRTV